jgi:2-keto-myo-inositol isomerase
MTTELRFALNHMIAPRLSPEAFFALAGELGIGGVEIRNDLAGNAILAGTSPGRIRRLAEDAGVRILSINALYPFDDWRAPLPTRAVALADYAQACGAEAIVLVPCNDGTRPDRLLPALESLKPILGSRRLTGLIEPLGFETCSLRLKSEAAAAIAAVEGERVFRLLHDTFHHRLAGEAQLFPAQTGLVHVSGVEDPGLAFADMRDAHRLLVTEHDRLGNVEQLRDLLAGGYGGFVSFEPFAEAVHALDDPAAAIRASIAVLQRASTHRGENAA